MNGLMKKYKLFIVCALVLLVVGMTLFGIFGLNQTVDYKNGYEVRVSIDQSIGDSKAILQNSTESYFESNGLTPSAYAVQKIDDGKTLIYKFNKEISLDNAALENYIQDKLNADVTDIDDAAIVSAEYSSVVSNDNAGMGWLALALGIGVVVAFIYALIMEKLSGAVAMLASSVCAALLFLALMGITRLPAYPYVGFGLALAAILGAVLSVATVKRCSEELKNSANAKLSVKEVAEKAIASEGKKYIFTAVAILICAVALAAFITPYFLIVGGQVAVAGVVGLACAYFISPLIWAAIKGSKK